ncbi:hypothetical protein DL93DRAFT_2103033 [Clavulina sp. PMI_390]|nr:hypothetical protein DL93DRAFT_2103033 [Clavulina sp. PMI_390]
MSSITTTPFGDGDCKPTPRAQRQAKAAPYIRDRSQRDEAIQKHRKLQHERARAYKLVVDPIAWNATPLKRRERALQARRGPLLPTQNVAVSSIDVDMSDGHIYASYPHPYLMSPTPFDEEQGCIPFDEDGNLDISAVNHSPANWRQFITTPLAHLRSGSLVPNTKAVTLPAEPVSPTPTRTIRRATIADVSRIDTDVALHLASLGIKSSLEHTADGMFLGATSSRSAEQSPAHNTTKSDSDDEDYTPSSDDDDDDSDSSSSSDLSSAPPTPSVAASFMVLGNSFAANGRAASPTPEFPDTALPNPLLNASVSSTNFTGSSMSFVSTHEPFTQHHHQHALPAVLSPAVTESFSRPPSTRPTLRIDTSPRMLNQQPAAPFTTYPAEPEWVVQHRQQQQLQQEQEQHEQNAVIQPVSDASPNANGSVSTSHEQAAAVQQGADAFSAAQSHGFDAQQQQQQQQAYHQHVHESLPPLGSLNLPVPDLHLHQQHQQQHYHHQTQQQQLGGAASYVQVPGAWPPATAPPSAPGLDQQQALPRPEDLIARVQQGTQRIAELSAELQEPLSLLLAYNVDPHQHHHQTGMEVSHWHQQQQNHHGGGLFHQAIWEIKRRAWEMQRMANHLWAAELPWFN